MNTHSFFTLSVLCGKISRFFCQAAAKIPAQPMLDAGYWMLDPPTHPI
jgi:hypothetical protein